MKKVANIVEILVSALAVCVIFSLASCSKNAKRSVGLTDAVSSEHQVKRIKPLEVPPFCEINEDR